MNLVLFDIDGTLTRTNRVDNDCFQETFARLFGRRVRPQDWHGLTHVTDAGILDGLLKNLRGRGPSPAETTAFKEDFFRRLEQGRKNEPEAFSPLPGAGELLGLLGADPEWRVALATGGWRTSALLKLEAAGLPFQGLPLATSDDAVSRTAILRKAMERAQGPGPGFGRVVSVGDGRWDLRAARELGLGFIGIGDKDQWRDWGVDDSRPDFEGAEGFIRLLKRVGL